MQVSQIQSAILLLLSGTAVPCFDCPMPIFVKPSPTKATPTTNSNVCVVKVHWRNRIKIRLVSKKQICWFSAKRTRFQFSHFRHLFFNFSLIHGGGREEREGFLRSL